MALTLAGTPAINGLTLPTDTFVSGMVLVNKTDFSAASSVSINNCFTSTYDNYKIVFRSTGSISGSGTPSGTFRLRTGGTDNTAALYYQFDLYSINGGSGYDWNSGFTSFPMNVGYDYFGQVTADISMPFATTYTSATFIAGSQGTGAALNRAGSIGHLGATSFDGFTFATSSGTFTGTVRVYGLRNA